MALKDSRIINVACGQDFASIKRIQVNAPLSMKADKFDSFVAELAELAKPVANDAGTLRKRSVADLDKLVNIWAVGLGLVTVNRNAFGQAVTVAELVAGAMESDKAKASAREDMTKLLTRQCSDNDWCDAFTWKVTNNHINRMVKTYCKRTVVVNQRQTQTGNVERTYKADVKAVCESVVDICQCKMQIQKTFI